MLFFWQYLHLFVLKKADSNAGEGDPAQRTGESLQQIEIPKLRLQEYGLFEYVYER